jgi:nicotinic acid mononucleotide adenylyltransferase
MEVLETDERFFTVKRSLTKLQNTFAGSELILLVGSDVAHSIASWPHSDQLLSQVELCIGVRVGDSAEGLRQLIKRFPVPTRTTIVQTTFHSLSSQDIRRGIATNTPTRGLLKSVHNYARNEWLYLFNR